MAAAAKRQRASGGVPAQQRLASRPKLQVLEGGRGTSPSRSKRPVQAIPLKRRKTAQTKATERDVLKSSGIAVGLAAVSVCAAWIFGLVLLNIYVAQSSFQLNELQKQVDVEENKFRQLRYQTSVAESPARLAEQATKLGLVTPERHEYLAAQPEQGDVLEPSEATTAEEELKALLAVRP